MEYSGPDGPNGPDRVTCGTVAVTVQWDLWDSGICKPRLDIVELVSTLVVVAEAIAVPVAAAVIVVVAIKVVAAVVIVVVSIEVIAVEVVTKQQ